MRVVSVFTRDLPIDTLHSIAGGIVTGILRNGNTSDMRGNLYSSLLNYLQFVSRIYISNQFYRFIRKPTLFANPQQDDYSQIVCILLNFINYSIASLRRI